MTSSKPTKKTGSSSTMKQSKLDFAAQKSSASSKLGKGKRSATPTLPVASEPVSEADGVSSDEDVPQTPVVEQTAVEVVGEELRLNDKRWAKPFKWARSKNEHLKPIHAEEQDKFDYILRVFDNSHEYGPCVGIPRLQRWERAQAMGLNPPPEIRDILLTQEGQTDRRLKEDCFFGIV